METEYQYLLHLLGAYLRKEAPQASDTADWGKLLELSRIHGVTGILGYMTMKYPICPDPERGAALRSFCRGTAARCAQRMDQAQVLVRQLEEAGIDHILMKGYVLRDFYPVPDLRTFNDIDLVIRQSDRQSSDALMVSLGFRRHTDWEPVYSYVRGNALYEIHTDIMEIDVSDRADYRGYFQKMWDYAQPIQVHSYRFTPEFHFLYLLTHIAKHVYGSGAGVRMYLDVAAFVNHYGDALAWPWVYEQLEQLQLTRFADVALTAAESWFGISCPMEHAQIPEDVMTAFQTFTLEAGTFGHYQREAALAGLKHTDQEAAGSRVRQILRRAFPKAETIQTRYTYLQDKPWLLPAAWIHRLVKTRDSLGKHTREAKQILRADTEEVLRMQALMRDIGL